MAGTADKTTSQQQYRVTVRQSATILLLLSTLSFASAQQSLPAATSSPIAATAATAVVTAAPAAKTAPIATAVAGALSTCSKSAMAGYTSALKLAPNVVLHWNAANDGKTIPFAVEATGAAASGWVSVAFSFNGLMAPSDAVVGNLAGSGVSAYRVASYSTVTPTSAIKLGAKSCVAGAGRTVTKFSRSVGDGGAVPVRVKGVNKLIWAYSPNGGKSVGYHGSNIGSTQVDFSCNGASPKSPTPSPRPSPSPPVPVVPPSQRSKLCPWSSYPGFTYMVQLKPLLFVHWRQVSPKVIEVAMEAKPGSGANNGWLSLAWTNNGKMAPADAVIGNRMGGTLGSYLITGYTMQSLKPATFSLGNYATVFKRNTGSTVMMFRRGAGGGTVPVRPTGLNKLIWAHSPSNSKTLAFHGGSYGHATIDFSCKVAPVAGGGDDDDDDH
ncbi:hypothetical protein CLOP_g4043 [Closterium sp. NIES-67]|nr:hypothetical protein CLOP_g4043 [Closterium sp. NIES-67]